MVRTNLLPSLSCLSGTPAEAGVRAVAHAAIEALLSVSVEPLPKQGCEVIMKDDDFDGMFCLSGTPAEAGVRGVC